MIRPPLIRTDMVLLSNCGGRAGPRSHVSFRSLVPAGGDLDLCLLPPLAVDIDALLLERALRGLREVCAVRLVPWYRLQVVVLRRRLGRELVVLRVHQADAERCRPDQRVDLVHLPRLVALEECWPVREDDLDAILHMRPAV